MRAWNGLLRGLAVILAGSAATAGRGAWSELSNEGSPAFSHHDMTYDAGANRLVVCGRDSFDGKIRSHVLGADGVWTAGPVAQSAFLEAFGANVEVAYDAHRGVVVMYTSDGTTTETWELSGDAWTLLAPATMPVACADGALLQYDPVDRRVILLGAAGYPDPGKANETWAWGGQDWVRLAQGEPIGGAGGGMVYDEARGEFVLLTMMTGRTWVFRGGVWTEKHPATAPSPPNLWVFDLGYDPGEERVFFFGGEAIRQGQPPFYPTTTWVWGGEDWAVDPSVPAPPPTIDYAIAYFPPLGGAVMHGGWCDPDWLPRRATWLRTSGAGPAELTGLAISVAGGKVILTWDPVAGANTYTVLSGGALASPLTPDAGGVLMGERWEKPLGGLAREFFSVRAEP